MDHNNSFIFLAMHVIHLENLEHQLHIILLHLSLQFMKTLTYMPLVLCILHRLNLCLYMYRFMKKFLFLINLKDLCM